MGKTETSDKRVRKGGGETEDKLCRLILMPAFVEHLQNSPNSLCLFMFSRTALQRTQLRFIIYLFILHPNGQLKFTTWRPLMFKLAVQMRLQHVHTQSRNVYPHNSELSSSLSIGFCPTCLHAFPNFIRAIRFIPKPCLKYSEWVAQIKRKSVAFNMKSYFGRSIGKGAPAPGLLSNKMYSKESGHIYQRGAPVLFELLFLCTVHADDGNTTLFLKC